MSNRPVTSSLFLALFLSVSVSSANTPALDLERDTRDLYTKNPKVRADAAERLVSAGSVAIPLLKHVLCDQSKANFNLAWPAAAKALGELKAKSAIPCLIKMLMYDYPNALGPVEMKSDETLAGVDPAFVALVQIGEPAVPVIRRHLPFLGPERALMAVRVLHRIDTDSAKEAVDSYIRVLENQAHSVKILMESPPSKKIVAR
jgi:hypothetical protein